MKKRLLTGLAVAGLAVTAFGPMAFAHSASDGCPTAPHSATAGEGHSGDPQYGYGRQQADGRVVAGVDGRKDKGGWAEIGVKANGTNVPDFYVAANNPSPTAGPNGVRALCLRDDDI